MCDSKIIAQINLEQVFLAEGNLGLMQLSCWRKKKKIYKIHKAFNLNSGKYCQEKKPFLNHLSAFPFQSNITRASIPLKA